MKLRLKTRLNKANKMLKKAYKSAEKVLFNKLPKAIGTPLAAILVVAPILLAIYTYTLGKSEHPSSVTVMITTLDGNGGGSGVVITNSTSESVVLTNSHVCGVLEKDCGKVRLVSGEEHFVTGYLTDTEHDLCMLTVAADLKRSVKIATTAPKLYEEATITGHPALMPNVITKGHFGGREIIPVMTGVRKCTEQDLKDPELAVFCQFFGLAPIITNYESQVVTATIMAGSSGSAVLNSDGELAGLVFAGNADGLSYAYIVPFEAVNNFVSRDLKDLNSLKWRPWENKKGSTDDTEEMFEEEILEQEIKNKCKNPTNDKTILKFCQEVIK